MLAQTCSLHFSDLETLVVFDVETGAVLAVRVERARVKLVELPLANLRVCSSVRKATTVSHVWHTILSLKAEWTHCKHGHGPASPC